MPGLINEERLTIFHASMYNDNNDSTITIAGADTEATITGWTEGFSQGFTYQNDGEFVCTRPGKYKVDWSLSSISGGNNQAYECTIYLSDVRQPECSAHRTHANVLDEGNWGATGIVDIAENEVVTMQIVNKDSAANIVIQHANMALTFVDV
jgi:hypothetical protein